MNEHDLRTALQTLAESPAPSHEGLERIQNARRRHDIRRRASRAATAVAGVAALAVLAVQLMPGSDDPSFAEPGPQAGGEVFAVRMVSWNENKVFNTRLPARQLSRDGLVQALDDGDPETAERAPAIDAEGNVFWVSVAADGQSSAIWRADADGNNRRQILKSQGVIQRLAVRGGDEVAFLVAAETGWSVHLARPEGTPSLLWQFPLALGRGISTDDSISVAWSPDASRLLVVDTFVDVANERAEETLLVLTDTGDAETILHGTHATWLPNGTILYRPLGPSTDGSFVVHDLTSSDEQPTDIKGDALYGPVVSPDGRLVALGNATDGTVLVANLEGGEHRVIDGGYPIFLSPTALGVSELRFCSPTDCGVPIWLPTERGRSLDLESGEEQALGATTQGAQVQFVHIAFEGPESGQ